MTVRRVPMRKPAPRLPGPTTLLRCSILAALLGSAATADAAVTPITRQSDVGENVYWRVLRHCDFPDSSASPKMAA